MDAHSESVSTPGSITPARSSSRFNYALWVIVPLISFVAGALVGTPLLRALGLTPGAEVAAASSPPVSRVAPLSEDTDPDIRVLRGAPVKKAPRAPRSEKDARADESDSSRASDESDRPRRHRRHRRTRSEDRETSASSSRSTRHSDMSDTPSDKTDSSSDTGDSGDSGDSGGSGNVQDSDSVDQ